jgi:enamine deaminase RidA (YjgF/YER057c/UK114 family)|tara:strand:+ start:8805 stop:9161 length:357 start_codon:yes stop_codon:yes gene_type:complete
MKTNYDVFHFAPATVIDNRVYASGQIGIGPDGKSPENLDEQLTLAFESVGLVLKEAGATFDDIVEMTTFHIGLGSHIQEFISVKDRYVKEPYPAWTAVGTTELAIPGAVVEIKVIAHI